MRALCNAISRVLLPQHITSSSALIFGELRGEDCLRRDAFVGRLAHYLGEVNALHPFREGSGRAQRAFFGQFARDAGFTLSWQHLDPAATSRHPPRSCAATPNRYAKC